MLYALIILAYWFSLLKPYVKVWGKGDAPGENQNALRAVEGIPSYPEYGICFGLEQGLIPCPIPAKKSIDDFYGSK